MWTVSGNYVSLKHEGQGRYPHQSRSWEMGPGPQNSSSLARKMNFQQKG